MTVLGRVSELWRYPISSLGGELVPELRIGARGADSDRCFGVVDAESGDIASPDTKMRWRPLPHIKTRLSDGRRPELSTDGQDWIEVPGDEADARLTAFLGFKASVRPYEDHTPLGYCGPVTANRYRPSPVHLLTSASLARLKTLHQVGSVDVRRFRPNILIDMPAIEGSFPETEWIGQQLMIGDLRLTISEPCQRCGFTILGQEGLDFDPEILRKIVRSNARNMGVYCMVDRPGTVFVGDEVWFN